MNILEVVGCSDSLLSSTASLVLETEKAYKENKLSKEEYIEILRDLENTASIEQHADYIEMQGVLLTGIAALLSVV